MSVRLRCVDFIFILIFIFCRDFVLEIRACETGAQERDVIRNESSNIRTALKNPKDKFVCRNVIKALFINLMGYNADFVKCLLLFVYKLFFFSSSFKIDSITSVF